MDKSLRNRLIVAFYLPSVLIAIAASILSPVLPLYASNLTQAYFLVGIILAAIAIGRVVGSIPSSWLLKNYGIKNTMLIGLWVSLLPMLLLFFTRNLWLNIALLFIVGIGLSIYSISRHAYIAVVIPLEIRGRAIGLLGGVFRTGKFIGPVIGGWLGATFGLPFAFLGYVVFAVISVLFTMRFMRNLEANIEEDKQKHDAAPSFIEMLQQNKNIFVSAGLGQIFAQLTREGWLVLIPLYAANVLQLDVQTIGIIMSVGAAFDMLFFYVSGIIMDRFGRKWAIVPSFTMQGLGIALILLTGSAFTLTLVASFIGFANGLSSGTMMTIGADFAPHDSRSEFLSVWHFIGDMGSVSGPVIVGAVAQALVIQTSVLSIAGAGFGAALLFALFVPETLKRRKAKELA